ncbi:MAG: ArnT family glycosyltransferase, partial [Candidatus Binatia bacterium]
MLIRPLDRWSLFAAVGLLSIYVALTVTALDDNSATFDETNHLVRGLYALNTGDFRLSREHPPLINMLQALPVHYFYRLALPIPSAEDYPYFRYSQTVLWKAAPNGVLMIEMGRLVSIGLTVLLGALVYHWSRLLQGPGGALVSLAAFVLSPMMLAHGALVTTDVGLALTMLLYWYSVWRFIRQPAASTAVLTSITLGLSVASKHLALLNIPVTFIVLAWTFRANSFGPFDWSSLRRALISALLIGTWLLGAWFIVWASYGFTVGAWSGIDWVVPAPDYWRGLLDGWSHLESGREYFLDDQRSPSGWFRYFPLALFYKTPWP